MVKKGKLGQVCLLLVWIGAALSSQEWSGSESVGVEVKDPRGRPIENAKVMLTYSGQSGGVGPPLVATDSRGQAVITGLVLGQWQIEVSHPDYLSYVGVLHMRPGKKAAVSTSFLEAAGTSLTPMKVKFFNAKNAAASPPISDERPDLPQLAAKKAQPVEPEPAPAAPAEIQEPPQPVVRSDQPPTTVTPPVGTYARDDDEAKAEREEVSKIAEPPNRPETMDEEPLQPMPVSSPEPEREPEPEPAVEVESQPEVPSRTPTEPEPESRPELESAPEVKTMPAPKPQVETTPELPAAPTSALEVEEQPIPQPQVQLEPESDATVSEGAPDVSEPMHTPPPLPEVPVPETIPESAVETVPDSLSGNEAQSQTRGEAPMESDLETKPEPPTEPAPSQAAPAGETEPIMAAEPDKAVEATAAPAQAEPQPAAAALPKVETAPAPEPTSPLEETRAGTDSSPTTAPPAAVPTPEKLTEPPADSQRSEVVPAPSAGVIGVGSYRDNTCPDCETGEWASANSKVVGAHRGDATCDQELIDTVEAAMRGLGDSINLELAGYLGPVFSPAGKDALGILESDLAKPFQDGLQPHVDGSSSCQIVAMVVPKAGRYTKTRYFAADRDSSRECSPGAECGLDNARWATSARVEKGYSATVVWALFENTASDRERRATLSVYFRPPNATWQPRTLGGQ